MDVKVYGMDWTGEAFFLFSLSSFDFAGVLLITYPLCFSLPKHLTIKNRANT